MVTSFKLNNNTEPSWTTLIHEKISSTSGNLSKLIPPCTELNVTFS